MKKRCWIHTGRSTSLCSRHKRAVIELAAKWNIDQETAAFELRDFESDVAQARHQHARVSMGRTTSKTMGRGGGDSRKRD
jgi:hypothetical protein